MTPAGLATRLALALALTLAIELPVAAALGLRTRRQLAAVAWIDVLTNPALNIIVLRAVALAPALATGAAGVVLILALEALVVLVEWGLLVWSLREDPARMLLVSLLINGASFGFGVLLQMLGVW